MVDRYVFIKLRDERATEAGRAEVAREAARVLSAVPGVVSVTAGLPADEHARRAWDVSLVVRFQSVAEADAYRDHPDHRRFVDEFLAPRTAVIKAWNMRVDEAAYIG